MSHQLQAGQVRRQRQIQPAGRPQPVEHSAAAVGQLPAQMQRVHDEALGAQRVQQVADLDTIDVGELRPRPMAGSGAHLRHRARITQHTQHVRCTGVSHTQQRIEHSFDSCRLDGATRRRHAGAMQAVTA